MNKNIAFTLSLLALIFSILACNTITIGDDGGGQTIIGTGSAVEQTRDVSGINAVELAMNGTLHISQGDTTSLRIEAQQNLLEYIQTDMRGDTLVIHTSPGTNVQSTRPIQYYLTIEKLEKIAISSSGDVEAGSLQSDSFSIKINSSGELSIDSLDCSSLDVEIESSGNTNISRLIAEKISVQISSSGNLKITDGQLQKQDVRISSSGDYQAKNVPSTSADINITSSGSATVRVSDDLSGRLSSSGNIYYAGDPDLDVRTTSSGRAIQID